jgi:hypothetical protein
MLTLLLAGSLSAVAQRAVVRANVPFNFTVNNHDFPAGEYTVFQIFTSNPGILMIRSADQRHATTALMFVDKNESQGHAKLVFDHEAERTVLRALDTGSQAFGLPATAGRRKLARIVVPAAVGQP